MRGLCGFWLQTPLPALARERWDGTIEEDFPTGRLFFRFPEVIWSRPGF
jgi:hypothetical protein